MEAPTTSSRRNSTAAVEIRRRPFSRSRNHGPVTVKPRTRPPETTAPLPGKWADSLEPGGPWFSRVGLDGQVPISV